jgi:hypothetical protein
MGDGSKWKPNMANAPVNATGEYLNRARYLIGRHRNLDPINAIHDRHGTFAYEYPAFFLVAKGYIYGDIVSCHLKLVTYAQATGKKIVMFIAENEWFYEFDPDEIQKCGAVNVRGDQEMLNFTIRKGKAWNL